jgi:putative ABC transport system ATP-binding protein
MSIIQCTDLKKAYPGYGQKALDGVSFTIERGSFVAITGRSGSGKTTLLNILAGLDRSSSGEVQIDGQRLSSLDETSLSRWRGRTVGVVFQFFQLFPTLSVAENIMLPMDLCRTWRGAKKNQRTLSLLESLGIADQADKLPHQLSGGQQQRAAIARALANDPPLIVADEPTGNLDSENSRLVIDTFAALTSSGKTVVMVTHEPSCASRADISIRLADGRLVENEASHA